MSTTLIVDDDADDRELIQRAIIENGKETKVIEADTCEKAWHLLQNVSPENIFLDINMPGGMNGLECLEKLRHELRYQGRITVMSTWIGESEIRECKKLNAGFFRKPDDYNAWRAIVGSVLKNSA